MIIYEIKLNKTNITKYGAAHNLHKYLKRNAKIRATQINIKKPINNSLLNLNLIILPSLSYL